MSSSAAPATLAPPPATPRFFFLDSLRALACMGVLLFHLCFFSPMSGIYSSHSPHLLKWLFGLGEHGVEIFFVISGFVIAYSLRSNPLTWPSIGRFILRRQVRLDPPYWAALLLTVLSSFVENLIPGLVPYPLPSLRAVVLNALYLHRIFPASLHGVLLDIAWTLCLEIQFYLLFIVLLKLTHRAPKQSDEQTRPAVPPLPFAAVAVMWLSGIICLGLQHIVVNAAYFWGAWHFFVAGVLVCWTLTRGVKPIWLWSFLLAFALSWGLMFVTKPVLADSIVFIASPTALVIGAASALVIYGMGRANKLDWGQHLRPVQFVGRISYSLYLTHTYILSLVLRGALKITKHNVPAAMVWFFVAIAACVGFAYLFYITIEQRSLKWTNALKSRSDVGLSSVEKPIAATPNAS